MYSIPGTVSYGDRHMAAIHMIHAVNDRELVAIKIDLMRALGGVKNRIDRDLTTAYEQLKKTREGIMERETKKIGKVISIIKKYDVWFSRH